MLFDRLPAYCTRLRIFLSYASDQRPLAERIAQTLTNHGHTVFFDKNSLPPAHDFNDQIRKAIRASDRFVFLASRSALAPGRYTLTEIEFARRKWPAPVGRVLPVLVDPELKPETMPTYLSSVHALSVTGNAPAEIAAAIEGTGRIGVVCWACLATLLLALTAFAGLASGVIPVGPPTVSQRVTTVAPAFVHFRPRARPPDDPSAPGADTNWTGSPVTVTLPVAYSHDNAAGQAAQLLAEEIELRLGDSRESYAWSYVVEIMGDSIGACADWLCQKHNVKAQNIGAGTITETRETMFLPIAAEPLSWKTFIDAVMAPDGPATGTVVLRSKIVVADGSARSHQSLTYECRFDAADGRALMLRVGYVPGTDPRPPTWQPRCEAAGP